VGIFKEKGLSQESADLGDLLDAIIRALGMPRSLADVKVGRDRLDGLAANSLHHRQVQVNPVPLTKKEQGAGDIRNSRSMKNVTASRNNARHMSFEVHPTY
jgi:alcohol dehydrogenase class IV